MMRALALSLYQLTDRAILAVLAKSIALTLALFAALGMASYYALMLGLERIGWAGGGGGLAAAASAALIAVFAGIVLFRAVALMVVGLFAEDVVAAVERRHYPGRAASASPPSAMRGFRIGVRSALRALFYNLLAMPIYLLLLATAFGAPLVFLGVNGLLIGQDMEAMVTARHDAVPDSAPLGIDRLQRFMLGLAAAFVLTIPFLNLLVPVIAAAMATHMIHGRERRTGGWA